MWHGRRRSQGVSTQMGRGGCETKIFRPPVSVRFHAKGPPGGTTPGSFARRRAARQRPGRRWPATALACQPSKNCQRSFHWHRTRCGNAGNFGVPPQRLQRAGALRDAGAPYRASRPGSGIRAPSAAFARATEEFCLTPPSGQAASPRERH